MRMHPALGEVAALFLKLGLTAFGGPAVHIAMMRRECVEKRRWLDDRRFLDLVGAVQIIPGPNSTEMAIHLGYLRAGWGGFCAAGLCFIAPAMLMALVTAWAYSGSGALPQIGWLLYGIKPVVLALLLQAVLGLTGGALAGNLRKGVFLAAFAAALYPLGEIGILAAAGSFCWALGARGQGGIRAAASGAVVAGAAVPAAAAMPALGPGIVFLQFLKIGSLVFGSGYVLLPFVRTAFAGPGGPLSEVQVLDAIAVGQLTPGPFFTTATFIGYLLGGWSGGLAATVGIFLPAFVLVALTSPWLPRLRASAALGRALDGVGAASLALMAAAAWRMAPAALPDAWSGLVFAAACLALWRKAGSTWVLLAGGSAGLALRAAGLGS